MKSGIKNCPKVWTTRAWMPPEQPCSLCCVSHVLGRYQKIGPTNAKTRLSENLMSPQTRRCNINAVYNVRS